MSLLGKCLRRNGHLSQQELHRPSQRKHICCDSMGWSISTANANLFHMGTDLHCFCRTAGSQRRVQEGTFCQFDYIHDTRDFRLFFVIWSDVAKALQNGGIFDAQHESCKTPVLHGNKNLTWIFQSGEGHLEWSAILTFVWERKYETTVGTDGDKLQPLMMSAVEVRRALVI